MEKLTDLSSGWDVMLKKREAMAKKAEELIEISEDGKCSYSKGYITQDVFFCKTCNTNEAGSGVCVGCYLACHLDHDIAELGPKASFRCDCGNSYMKNTCSFTSKSPSNAENTYNQNFIGKFCICGMEDSEDRESEMYMCIGCYDWFHADCITLSNNCHATTEELLPTIPSDLLSHYYFICDKCIRAWKFIPAAYKHYIYFEGAVKRGRVEGCPLEDHGEISEYPFHIFLKKEWLTERCSCDNCKIKFWPKQLMHAHDMEEKVSLLDTINEETAKILEDETIEGIQQDENQEEDDHQFNALSHEAKIDIANGIQIFKDAFEEMANNMNGKIIDALAVEEFKIKLLEKHQAYKRAKNEQLE